MLSWVWVRGIVGVMGKSGVGRKTKLTQEVVGGRREQRSHVNMVGPLTRNGY
jgi:hypothetical protein